MRKQSIYHQHWYANEYDTDRFGGPFGRYLQEREIDIFFSLLNGHCGRVLDVGTGTGKLTLPALRQSRPVISIDFSPEMLTVANQHAKTENLILRSAICDAHRLAFHDNAFECVVSSRVLMHLVDWRLALSELCRVSRHAVVLDFPPLTSLAGLDSLFRRCKCAFVPHTRSYKAFFIRSVSREFRKHNYKIVVLRKTFFLPVAFHRWLNSPRLSSAIERVCRSLGLVWVFGAPVTLKAIKRNSGNNQGKNLDA